MRLKSNWGCKHEEDNEAQARNIFSIPYGFDINFNIQQKFSFR